MSPALLTLASWLAAGRAIAHDALADLACTLAARLYVWGYGHVPAVEPSSAAPPERGDDELEPRRSYGCARCEDDPEPCETCVTAADVADPRTLARAVAGVLRRARTHYPMTIDRLEHDDSAHDALMMLSDWTCEDMDLSLRARVERYRAAVERVEEADEPAVVVGGDS